MTVFSHVVDRSRGSRAFLMMFCALAAAFVFASAALADTMVTYFNSTAVAGTAYSNEVLGNKTYNEMFASNNTSSGEAVGIYLLTSGGSKIRAFNALGFVFWGPVADANAEFSRAYCWNRYVNINFNASCWYQHP
jgi:hypothetical protein